MYTRHLQVVEAVCFSIHEVANRKLCPPQGSQLFCQGSTVHFKQPGIIPQRHNFLMLGTRTNIWVPERESLNAGFSRAQFGDRIPLRRILRSVCANRYGPSEKRLPWRQSFCLSPMVMYILFFGSFWGANGHFCSGDGDEAP